MISFVESVARSALLQRRFWWPCLPLNVQVDTLIAWFRRALIGDFRAGWRVPPVNRMTYTIVAFDSLMVIMKYKYR